MFNRKKLRLLAPMRQEVDCATIRSPLRVALSPLLRWRRKRKLARLLRSLRRYQPQVALGSVRGRIGNRHQHKLAVGREQRPSDRLQMTQIITSGKVRFLGSGHKSRSCQKQKQEGPLEKHANSIHATAGRRPDPTLRLQTQRPPDPAAFDSESVDQKIIGQPERPAAEVAQPAWASPAPFWRAPRWRAESCLPCAA